MKLLHAYTAPGSHYPAYINVSEHEGVGGVRVTVRSPRRGDSCGSEAHIDLSPEQHIELVRALLAGLGQSLRAA